MTSTVYIFTRGVLWRNWSLLANLSVVPVFFSFSTLPLHCPALFGILAGWLHSRHLGQLTERVSTRSDLRLILCQCRFLMPHWKWQHGISWAQHTYTPVILPPYAGARSHIHTHLTVMGEHWRSRTSLSLPPTLLELLSKVPLSPSLSFSPANLSPHPLV